MDVDRSNPHDFYSLEEINEQFDAISCFEVVEHMTAAMGLQLFYRAHQLLRSEGRLFVSTPNVYHPMSFWSDATHITPFRIRHLAGWLASAGFTKFWDTASPGWIGKKVALLALSRAPQAAESGFAPGILVIAEK